jgi:hypothetical protein
MAIRLDFSLLLLLGLAGMVRLASLSWQTCYQHYHRWQHISIWISIIKTLLSDLYERGGLDLQQPMEIMKFLSKESPRFI